MTFKNIMILIKSVFNKEINNCYYNMFLERVSYESPKNKFLYKSYIMIELMFLNTLMLTKQANQKSAIFVTIGIF